VYEHGVLRPLEPLVLPEHQRVRLTLEERPAGLSWESSAPINERREELLWLANESASCAGEWVALDGPRLIAHGAKLADVSAAATAAGIGEPFFARVPREKGVPFGGWSGMHRREFTHIYDYSGDDEGVVLPVLLRSGAKQVRVAASVDTGASFCMFGAEIAEALGLNLETGTRTRFRTANSRFEAFGHEIELGVFDVVTDAMVYFFADPAIDKNRGGENRMARSSSSRPGPPRQQNVHSAVQPRLTRPESQVV
jgi:predicted DNA-binding antitoxin AbrB/MazE fold protein